MSWRVHLQHAESDFAVMETVFRAWGLRLVAVAPDRSQLEGAAFETLNDAEDVQGLVSRLLEGFTNLKDHKGGFEVHARQDGGVRKVDSAGNETANICVSTGFSSTKFGRPFVLVGHGEETIANREEREHAEREAELVRRQNFAVAYVLGPLKHPMAKQVERWLREGDLTPTRMYNIAEALKADRSAPRTDYASSSEWERFERSVNHPATAGDDARHAVNHFKAPPNPMTMDECRRFIREVAHRWFIKIASRP